MYQWGLFGEDSIGREVQGLYVSIRGCPASVEGGSTRSHEVVSRSPTPHPSSQVGTSTHRPLSGVIRVPESSPVCQSSLSSR